MPRASTPSLTSLRAFEAYARTGRLIDAADELCVTHGAISRQIKQLEQQLRVKLLTGHPGKVTLTEAAARYARTLTRLFDELEEESAALRKKTGETGLQILCPGSLAMRWLIPRIRGFTDRHPEIALDLLDSSGPWNPAPGGPHGAIRMQGYEGTSRARARSFMPRQFGPVLSPALLDGTMAIDRLLALPRLIISSTPTDWRDWAGQVGVVLPDSVREMSFDRSFHMLEGVFNGLGVGIADEIYVAGEIEAGRLVAPLGFVASPRDYVFLRGEQCENASVDLFERWLVEIANELG